jgi:hypothetical protein
MTAETERLVRDLVAGIHASAASGLLGRDLIILATEVEQQLHRDSTAADRGPTSAEIEAAAQAIVETWAAENGSDLTWAEALLAEKEPDEFRSLSGMAPLARKEARNAIIAAAAHRRASCSTGPAP